MYVFQNYVTLTGFPIWPLSKYVYSLPMSGKRHQNVPRFQRAFCCSFLPVFPDTQKTSYITRNLDVTGSSTKTSPPLQQMLTAFLQTLAIGLSPNGVVSLGFHHIFCDYRGRWLNRMFSCCRLCNKHYANNIMLTNLSNIVYSKANFVGS